MILQIFEEITEKTLEKVSSALAGSNSGEVLDLEIASYGGELLEAIAIVDQIKAHGLKSRCKIVGFAASAAAIIALACDHVAISPLGSLMIHSAWTEEEDDSAGVNRCNQLQLQIINNRNPNLDKALFTRDNWFNAEESLKLGLVDEILYMDTTKTFAASAAKIAACLHFIHNEETNMDEIKIDEVVEQVKEEEKNEEPVAEAAPSLVDVIEEMARKISELEERLARVESGAAPAPVEAECEEKDPEQARINNLYKTLCKPQAALGAVRANTKPVQRVDYKNFKSFIDG